MTGSGDDRADRDRAPDMSPAAIARRLERMGQLYEVWLLLRTARRIGPVADADSAPRTWRGDAPERRDAGP